MLAGPALPFYSESKVLYASGSTLVTSPTTKGVILIGGDLKSLIPSPFLYELSGDSEDNLTWTKLDQKLDEVRSHHVSFPIPNDCLPLNL